MRDRKPRLNPDGRPEHGVDWDGGVVLRAISRGPGQPVEVRAPRASKPQRVLSGDGNVETKGAKTFVTPRDTPAGQPFSLVADFG